MDCQSEWGFQTVIAYPDNVVRLAPELPVTVLGVEAKLTYVEVSPVSVYVVIEGDALKGHHSWTPKNAPDGFYGCVEYQEVVAHTTDGEAIALTKVHTGSGCSGGDDFDEPVYLHLSRTFDTLMDLDKIAYLTVCGVPIPID